MSDAIQTTVTINNLSLLPNIRKVINPDNIEKLASSILAEGLVQPILVRDHPSMAGEYQVVAGQRRFLAFQLLIDKKKISEDYEIPVMVQDILDNEIAAKQLHENYSRAEMHPMDKFAAIKQMSRDGMKQKDICSALSITPTQFKQVVKLADLIPEVADLFRANKIKQEQAQAFTLGDATQQAEALEFFGDTLSQQSDWRLKDHFTGNSIPARYARFDLKDYPKHYINRDLFTENTYLTNRPAFFKLQENFIEEARALDLENGWSWSEVKEVERFNWNDFQEYGFLDKVLSPELQEEDDKLDAELDEIDWREVLPEDEAAALRIRAASIRERREEIENLEYYTDEGKASAGVCYLLHTTTGEVKIGYGNIKVAEEEETAPDPQTETEDNPEPVEQPEDDKAKLTKAQVETHRGIYTKALQNRLAADPILGLKILAMHVMADRNHHISLAFNECSNQFKGDMPITEEYSKPSLEIFKAFEQDDNLSTINLIGAMIGVKFAAVECQDRLTDFALSMGKYLYVDIRGIWTPDVEYLSGYRKDELARIYTQLGGPANVIDTKKSGLVEMLNTYFNLSDTLTNEADIKAAERAKEWLPDDLNVPLKAIAA